MKLANLTIQNFLSVKSAKLELADKGLVSIEGINEDETGSDSNGCGKSTIVNAILWCLYGSYGKEGSADDVVNSLAGKACLVRSRWLDGDRVYTITRFRKDPKFKNRIVVELDGKEITKAGSTAVQQQINEIMGADEMVFRASCFAQQENPLDIPSLTDSKLKSLLEECLPFEGLTELHEKAIKEVQAKKAVIDALQMKIWDFQGNTKLYKHELKEALDLRFKYADETLTKDADIDKQIKLKNTARGIALSMSNLGTLKEEIATLEYRIDDLGETSGYLTDSYKHSEAEKYVGALKWQLENPVNTCGECGQEIEDLDKVISRIKFKLYNAEVERDKLRDKAKISSYKDAQKRELKRQVVKLNAELLERERNAEMADRLKAEISLLERSRPTAGENPYNPTVKRLREALKAAIEGHKSYSDLLAKAEAELEVRKAVQLTYSPKGLRYHLLEKIAPKLTADTNRYLSVLTDGAITAIWSTVTKVATGDYKEKFSIEAHMEGRKNFGLLSGGEKRKVRLACFFALQDLVASQATKNIELWVGDEIDHALDEAGLERVMTLLNEKVKQKKTILVISHNDLKGWIPQTIRVTRRDGISTVVQE